MVDGVLVSQSWFKPWAAPSSSRDRAVVGPLLESLSLAQTVVVGTLLESLSLAQTVSDPGMRLRGDLPKPSARLLDWCANPGFGTLLES